MIKSMIVISFVRHVVIVIPKCNIAPWKALLALMSIIGVESGKNIFSNSNVTKTILIDSQNYTEILTLSIYLFWTECASTYVLASDFVQSVLRFPLVLHEKLVRL